MEKKYMKEINENGNVRKNNIRLPYEERIKEIKEIDSKISMNEKIYTIGITLILAIIYDQFFTDKQMGVSIPIFYLMFMGVFLWSIRRNVRSINNIRFIMMIATLVIAINFSIHSNNILNYFNGVMLLLLTIVTCILIRYRERKWEYKELMKKVFSRVIIAIPENILKPFAIIRDRISLKTKKENNSINKNILRGVIISIPLLILILFLLTSSDMVFKYYLLNISSGLKFINIEENLSHMLIIIIMFLVLFSFIWSFKYDCKKGATTDKIWQWEPISLLTIIFMINVVYLLFSIVQFTYLYGGSNHLPSGFTYSEYARKGFFELFIVTIINFTIVLCSMKFIKKDNKTIIAVANILLTLLVVFTINMLFSAHYKMSLYEQTYGFTYLRIFVHIFMFMLFMLFTITLAGIWYRRMPINKVLLITVLIMYIVLNYINVDKIIAQKNIDRYYKTQKIDMLYLESLSYDAFPVIMKLKNDSNEEIASEFNRYLESTKKSYQRRHHGMNLIILNIKLEG